MNLNTYELKDRVKESEKLKCVRTIINDWIKQRLNFILLNTSLI
jgi:hypothetical protein